MLREGLFRISGVLQVSVVSDHEAPLYVFHLKAEEVHVASSAAPLPTTREVAEGSDFIAIPSKVVPREPRLTARLATFKISQSDAYEIAARAAELRTKEGHAPTVFVPIAVIGRCYFFGKPYKTKILLTGYYVDGDSGEVSWREGGEYTPKK